MSHFNCYVPNLRLPGFEISYQKTKIGKCLKIKSGQDKKDICCDNGKYNIYGTGGIIGTTNLFLYDKESVGIGRKGTIDKPFYFDKPFWTVDTLFYSVINKGFYPKYIYYLFQTINWKKYNSSTGVPSLTSTTIESIEVSLPLLEEQRKIAEFLTMIDARIDAQNKIIEDLTTLRKGIIDSFFKSSISSTRLIKYLRERKTYSEKGEGYEHVTLSKEGICPKTDRYDRDFLVKNEDKNYKITKLNDICYNPANLKFRVICLNDYGDAIFSPIYVTFEVQNIDPYYLSLYLTSESFIKRILKYQQGTVYERMAVGPDDFCKGRIPIKSEAEINNLVNLVSALDKKIKSERGILEKFCIQKSYLLNNLFI